MLRRDGWLLLIASLLFSAAGLPDARTVQLRGNVPGTAASLRLSRRAVADKPLDLRIYFALRDRATLDRLLADQQDPNSPQYHQWLTPNEFAARFGPTETDFSAVTGWLHAEGLSIVSADIKSREIRYADTVSHAEQMFSTRIFSSADGRYFGNAWGPSIPERFKDVIAFVDGLDNLRVVVPASHVNQAKLGSDPVRGAQIPPMQLATLLTGGISSSVETEPDFKGGGSIGIGPADLHTFYDETPLLNAGIDGSSGDCIALLELSDFPDFGVDQFDQAFSQPDAAITRVFADTTTPGQLSALTLTEAMLDVEWAHAAAPGAPLTVYIGDPTSVGYVAAALDTYQRAINDNSCSIFSISIGQCGTPESFFPGVVGAGAAQAASQGMSIFVSSGDYGAAGSGGDATTASCVPETTRGVNEIAASPNVTAVGGTQAFLKYDSSDNDVGFVPEQVWNEPGIGASGGGASGAYPKPDYQQGLTPNDGARDLPDVAALAQQLGGYFLDLSPGAGKGVYCCEGGTSVSAPVWAGFAALIAQLNGGRLGNINPRLYQLGPLEDKSNVGLRDVTKGNNSFKRVQGFNAGPLYDQATGWGSPDVAILAKALLALPTPTPTPTLAPGQTPAPTPTPTSIPTPTPIASATPMPAVVAGAGQLGWDNDDGIEYDQVNPSGANGAAGPDAFIIKTSNTMVLFGRPPNAPLFGTRTLDDYYLIEPVGAVAVPAFSRAPVSNQSRIYYDPDGPSTPGCAPGGRWLFLALSTAGAKATLDKNGRRPLPGTRGVLIASSPGPDPTVDPSTWYKVFLPANCAFEQGCADSPQLGWNSSNIAVALNNYSFFGKWHPALLTVSHDALECGHTSSQPALGFQVFANDPSVAKTPQIPQPAWDVALQSACPAQTYSSPVGQDFTQGSLYLINVPNNSTSTVEISTLQAGSTPKLVAGAMTVRAPSSWAQPPATFAQNGSTTKITFSPGDARFTSCMVRNGAMWAGQTVGSGSPATPAAQWWEIGLMDGLTAGKVYAFNQIGGGQSINQNVVNPSIAANSHCPSVWRERTDLRRVGRLHRDTAAFDQRLHEFRVRPHSQQ